MVFSTVWDTLVSRPSSIPGDIDLAVSAYSWTPAGSGAELGHLLGRGNHWGLGNSLEIDVLMGKFFINGNIRLILDVLMGWK